MRITAIENYDNVTEGQTYECPDHQATQLIKKGLAKAAQPLQNKMAPAGENKADPTAAAGEGAASSASRAAPVSLPPTAQVSGDGAVIPDPKFADKDQPSAADKQKAKPATKSTSKKKPGASSS